MTYFLWSQLQNIPDDVIREHILPYTYQPQSPILCADIRSFYNTYHNMCEIYSLAYPLHNESKEWLSNDISRFLNDDFATMYGYRKFYINTYRRMFMNRDKDIDTIVGCIQYNDRNHRPNDIQRHIGLMTPQERLKLEDFLMDNTFPND
tara:strand:- start:457 stop:903 length:447 start_codon:yes stop_codon:yes gene_type:complete